MRLHSAGVGDTAIGSFLLINSMLGVGVKYNVSWTFVVRAPIFLVSCDSMRTLSHTVEDNISLEESKGTLTLVPWLLGHSFIIYGIIPVVSAVA